MPLWLFLREKGGGAVKNRLITLPIKYFTVAIVLGCALWIVLNAAARLLAEKRGERLLTVWRIVNAVLAVCCAGLLLYLTVFSRRPLSSRNVFLQPFYILRKALTQQEYKREKLLNLYAFIPFGVTLSGALLDRRKEEGKRHLSPAAVVLFGFLLTFAIELTQGITKLGTAETDDVLTNTAGVFVGVLVWWISELIGFAVKRTKRWNKSNSE